MGNGGQTAEQGAERQWSPRREPVRARLTALGASAALHLLGVAALGSSLLLRNEPPHSHSPALTVIALRQVSKPIKPEERPGPRQVEARADFAPAATSEELRPTVALPSAAAPIAATVALPEQPDVPVVPARMEPAPVSAESDEALRSYREALWREIDRNRPRGVNMSGTVLLQFEIGPDGSLRTARVARSSGNILLDRIALRTLRQASPYPRPPAGAAGADLVFEIPINFH